MAARPSSPSPCFLSSCAQALLCPHPLDYSEPNLPAQCDCLSITRVTQVCLEKLASVAFG